jgi:transaldolase
MTEFGFGAVSVLDENGKLAGIFTDGDLRRKLMENREILHKNMGDFSYNKPQTIDANALLQEALQMFKTTNVDTLIVTQNDLPIGMLDIQDVKL